MYIQSHKYLKGESHLREVRNPYAINTMDYEQFKNDLREVLETYDDIPKDINFFTTVKNNGVRLKAMSIKSRDSAAIPSIIIEEVFKKYSEGMDIKKIGQNIHDTYIRFCPGSGFPGPELTWSEIRENLFFTLINSQRNEEMLKNCPHLDFLCYSLIFKIDVTVNDTSGSITVNNKIFENLNVELRNLMIQAISNTPKKFPLKFKNLCDTLCSSVNENESYTPVPNLWLVTNEENYYGASAILYPELYEKLEPGKKNFIYYPLPSSVHEFLVIESDKSTDPDELTSIVRQVNESNCVSATDYLSDEIYSYKELLEAFNKSCIEAGLI